MNNHLDTDLLQTFLEVVESQSFTRAAQRLHRVQSSVSMQVRRLERMLGAKLFDRTPRAVTLTAEGEMLVPYARRMLRLNQEMITEMHENAVEATVRLGVTATSVCYLPRLLARYAQNYPRTRLEVLCDLSVRLLAALEDKEIDLALVTQDCGRQDGTVVRREPLVWAAARDFFPEEENPLPLAVFGKGCVYRDAALKALDGARRPWRIAFMSPSNAGVHAAISAGLAVGAVARSTVTRNLRVLGREQGFPELPHFELLLFGNWEVGDEPVKTLAAEIFHGLDNEFVGSAVN